VKKKAPETANRSEQRTKLLRTSIEQEPVEKIVNVKRTIIVFLVFMLNVFYFTNQSNWYIEEPGAVLLLQPGVFVQDFEVGEEGRSQYYALATTVVRLTHHQNLISERNHLRRRNHKEVVETVREPVNYNVMMKLREETAGELEPVSVYQVPGFVFGTQTLQDGYIQLIEENYQNTEMLKVVYVSEQGHRNMLQNPQTADFTGLELLMHPDFLYETLNAEETEIEPLNWFYPQNVYGRSAELIATLAYLDAQNREDLGKGYTYTGSGTLGENFEINSVRAWDAKLELYSNFTQETELDFLLIETENFKDIQENQNLLEKLPNCVLDLTQNMPESIYIANSKESTQTCVIVLSNMFEILEFMQNLEQKRT